MRVSARVLVIALLGAFLLGAGTASVLFSVMEGDAARAPRAEVIKSTDAQEPVFPQVSGESPDKGASHWPGQKGGSEVFAPAPSQPEELQQKSLKSERQPEPKHEPAGGADSAQPAQALDPSGREANLGRPMPYTAQLSGTVVDATGNPVPGAEVFADMVERGGMMTAASSLKRLTVADSMGVWQETLSTTAGDKATVTLALHARHAEFAESRHVPLEVKNGDSRTGIRIVLRSPGTVRGTVRHSSGNGIAGATVTVEARDQEEGVIRDATGGTVMFRGTRREATTDASGAFVLSGLPTGEYNIVLRAPGYRESAGPRTVLVKAGTPTLAADFVVEQATSIRLLVQGASNEPLAEWISIEFQDGQGQLVKKLRGRSGQDGILVLNDPPLGAFSVVVTAPGKSSGAPAWHTFLEDQQTDLGTVTLTPIGAQESRLVMPSSGLQK